MKTFITCILFSVCCSISIAQNYVPFPSSNAIWRGARYWIDSWQPQLTGHNWEYNQAIVGDTIINGMTYHKLEETSIENIYNLPQNILISSTYNGTHYAGAFREDSLKRIYFQNGSMNELLFYDFNLTVGDSFQTALTGGYYLHVTSIDSFFDGFIYRKKIILDNISYDVFLIEGIGANTGFTDNFLYGLENWSDLNCYRENNIIKYSDSTTNCSLVNVNENQFHQSSFTLSPNPTTEILNLKSGQPILFPLELFVMDMQGKLIKQKILLNESDLSLNVKLFSNGEYLLGIKNKEAVLFHGIFSKQ